MYSYEDHDADVQRRLLIKYLLKEYKYSANKIEDYIKSNTYYVQYKYSPIRADDIPLEEYLKRKNKNKTFVQFKCLYCKNEYYISDSKKKYCSKKCSKEYRKLKYKEKMAKKVIVDENTSDGYHTFKELYDFRKAYNALTFNEWAKYGKYQVHKSKLHNDGTKCFDGNWFIVSAMTPFGQISNHYELKDWDLFDIPEKEKALFEFDGHNTETVLDRLIKTAKFNDNPPYISDDFQIGYDGAYENED